MLTAMDNTCGDDCRYRRLYEGTQSSLTDMAGKHATALGRIGRLRNSVIDACKNSVPAAFSKMEQKMSVRLSEADDQMISAMVEHLLRHDSGPQGADVLVAKELRQLLAWRGVILKGDNPADWLTQLGGVNVAVEDESARATKKSFMAAKEHRRQMEQARLAEIAATGAAPTTWSQAVEGLVDIDNTQSGATKRWPEESAQPQALSDSDTVLDFDDTDVVFGDETFGGDTFVPDTLDGGTDESSGWGDAWGDNNTLQDEPEREEFNNEIGASAALPTSVSTGTDTPESALPKPVAPPTPVPTSEPVAARPVKMAPATPVRVELFPNPNPGRAKRGRRQVRVAALPPESFDVIGLDVSSKGDAATNAKIQALCTIPRPVFTSDLINVLGDSQSVEQWQEDQRADGSNVRFIAPKARHKQRGSLIVPVGQARSDMDLQGPTWWSAVLDRYRGAKLYELGVVCHSVQDTIKSYNVDSGLPVVTFKIAHDRGVVGLVVLCDDELHEGSIGRDALRSGVEEMLGASLEMLCVLVTGDKSLDPACIAVSEEFSSRGWKIGCPVVGARSWEWANAGSGLVEIAV